MTKNPAEPDDTSETKGGKAAERLRDLMRGRFPDDRAAESKEAEQEGDAAPEDTRPGPERDPTKD